MTLRELGIVPVFPPREDVFVGDVYAYQIDPEGDVADKLLRAKWSCLDGKERRLRQALGMSPRLHRFDVNAIADQEYRRTLAAPATPSDYNSILGNQAVAAAQQKLQAAERALKAVNDRLKEARTAVTSASDALLAAQREKEDGERALEAARKELERAKAAKPDTSVTQQAVTDATSAVRNAEQKARNAVAERDLAQAKAERLPAGSDDRKKADEALASAEDRKLSADAELVEAQAKLRIATDYLAAANAERPGVAAAETAVRNAEDAVRAGEDALVTTQRDKANADQALARLAEATKEEIDKMTAAVDAAKSIRDAIAKAGERLLYAQPRDAQRSVFVGAPLDTPGDANDLLNARINRLRLVGFPEFASASFTQGDLSALIPIESFSLGINASASSARRVSVKVPSAESYGVPVSALLGVVLESAEVKSDGEGGHQPNAGEADAEERRDAEERLAVAKKVLEDHRARLAALRAGGASSDELKRVGQEIDLAQRDVERVESALRDLGGSSTSGSAGSPSKAQSVYLLAPEIRQAVELQFSGLDPRPEHVYVRVPTEVFYARALDVSVFYGEAYGLRARLSTWGASDDSDDDKGSESFGPYPIDPTGKDLLRSVENSLGKTMTVPGGAIQVVGVNETSIGLRRVFDRPVAIGFRGLTLKVNLDSWVVVGAISGGATPTTSLSN